MYLYLRLFPLGINFNIESLIATQEAQILVESNDTEPMEERPVIEPADVEPVTPVEPEKPRYDNKWYGVPAKGEEPLPEKWKYVYMIFGVIVIEICIWAVYRWSTAEFFESFGTHQFYLLHIIAAPTIHLLPILLFWWFIRKERGLPFVFTKKLLLTGIIVGFVAAIIWRLLEEFTYDAFAGMAGGTVPGTFTFLNLLETADLFILMTFVMYFIVGPVEELEFRGFVYDQSARVLPNLQALIFSSVLFGCSHIPIAVFVYQFTPTQFIDALFGWIAAGFVFGALYMWSRNIFACMVMHAMGNWQLSVFNFTSAPAGMDATTSMFVGIATSFVANAVMIIIFYLIHKYYWEPHRRGEPAFGGKLLSLQRILHDHDFENKPLPTTILIFVVFIVIISGIIMGAAATMGRTSFSMPESEGASESKINLENFIEEPETISGSGELNDGELQTILIYSEQDKYIKEVSVVVTWIDDAAAGIIYENQPDTFSVTLNGPNFSANNVSSNPVGGQGSVSTMLTFSSESIVQFIESDGEEYEVVVEIQLEATGDQEGRLAGVFTQPDNRNQYNYDIDIVWLTREE